MTPPVRVGAALYQVGPLACPRCQRVDRTYIEVYGILRLTCTERAVYRGVGCRTSWTAVRLPPGATGAELIAVFGLDGARGFLRALRPDDDPPDDAALAVFPVAVDPVVPWYAQRAPDVPEPMMGWRRASDILASVLGRGETKGAA